MFKLTRFVLPLLIAGSSAVSAADLSGYYEQQYAAPPAVVERERIIERTYYPEPRPVYAEPRVVVRPPVVVVPRVYYAPPVYAPSWRETWHARPDFDRGYYGRTYGRGYRYSAW